MRANGRPVKSGRAQSCGLVKPQRREDDVGNRPAEDERAREPLVAVGEAEGEKEGGLGDAEWMMVLETASKVAVNALGRVGGQRG